MRARTLRTQQRVTYQYQYPVRGLGLRTYATAEIPLVDKKARNCQICPPESTQTFMESLILAQDERWRRA